MKKWFKNLFLTLLLVLSFNSVKSQNSITIYNSDYNKWEQTNSTCYGCGSIYVMIVNTQIPDKSGLYYYDIYLWSNSFYPNGYASTSYVKNIKIYVIDPSGKEVFILKLDYALVQPKSQYFNGAYYLAYVYSRSARQTIKVSWSEINVW